MTVPVGENEPTVQIHGLVCQPSLLPSAPPGARLAGAPECLAVGDSSLVETLPIPRAWATDGSTWSDLDTGLLGRSVNSLSAVTCVARTACVATGWTVYERATTTAAAFTVPPGSVVRASASDRRQAVVATYAAPSPPTVTPGGTSSAWPRILVAVPGVGLVLVAVLAWRRRARQRDT